jgi:hypothetical protein
MPDFIIRVGIVLLIGGVSWLLIYFSKRYIEVRRQRALRAEPPGIVASSEEASASVRILAFSSADCRQCYTLQKPALQQVLTQRAETVTVVEIDAPSSPELTERYHVLTVPTTVVLDVTGQAYAINYGFANVRRLLEQVDALLAQEKVQVVNS